MEDKHICPGLFCYSFRVDYQDTTAEDMRKKATAWLEKFEIDEYILYEETSKEVKKLHFQGAVWVKHKRVMKLLTKMRNWWCRPKGAISLTIAKNVKNLTAYISKDGELSLNSLSNEQLGRFPLWETDQKKVWLKKLELKAKQLVSETNDKCDYCCALINFYTKNDKAPPTRNTLYKFLLRYHPSFEAHNYLTDLGMFREIYASNY